MNLKDIIGWGVRHWWWFAISVVLSVFVGCLYYVHKTPVFAVNATLMLRQLKDDASNQGEMIKMMGFGSSKIAADEVMVLTSRDLVGQVVDTLDLTTTCYAKEGRYWKIQYPNHLFTVHVSQPLEKSVGIKLKIKNGHYVIKVKTGFLDSKKYTVQSLDEPISTKVGELTIVADSMLKEGTYKIILQPRIEAIDKALKDISVTRLGRESNIITLCTKTTCPARSIDILNALLELYNMEGATDKNRLALQTDQFLTNRIEVISKELSVAEADLESYKRTNRIADLDKTADTYQQIGNEYEQKVAEVDAQKQVLDFVAQQIIQPENACAAIPGNLSVQDATLEILIQDYNQHVVSLKTLLQTATETNPTVLREMEILQQKRSSIQTGIEQVQKRLQLEREHVLNQQRQYNSRLESIPETERCYLEMKRDKQTKENQYLYLIEKREENALLLASEAVPSKIVEHAQLNPNKLAPRFRNVGVLAILIGLLLPYLFYFYSLFRKEYL